MELLNEHEFSKSLFEICNNLDKDLINHLIKCKKILKRMEAMIHKENMDMPLNLSPI